VVDMFFILQLDQNYVVLKDKFLKVAPVLTKGATLNNSSNRLLSGLKFPFKAMVPWLLPSLDQVIIC